MAKDDEPIFQNDRGSGEPNANEPLFEIIRRLVTTAPFAVLCTQGEGQPYGSLVAFAFTDDLRSAVFATPRATRKYQLLSLCERVSLVIDNRPNHPEDMMQVEAVTMTGRSVELKRGAEFDSSADLLVKRHPYLKSFVQADSCALFRVDSTRFFHVWRFQEVRQWVPPKR